MFDIIDRILLGFLILGVGGWLSWFFVNLLTDLSIAIAALAAKGVRALFGVRGTWTTDAAVALVAVAVGKAGVSMFLVGSLFFYAFFAIHQESSTVLDFLVAGVLLSATVVLLPSVFFMLYSHPLTSRKGGVLHDPLVFRRSRGPYRVWHRSTCGHLGDRFLPGLCVVTGG